jgi:hypothetical protein
VRLLLLILPLTLGGCIARTAVDIVTLPVKVAAAGVDAVTTSQSEADEKRGRQIRKYEECIGKEERSARKDRREPDYGRCEKLQPR